MDVFVFHPHYNRGPCVAHACLLFKDGKQYVLFRPYVPFKPEGKFPEFPGGVIPSFLLDGCEESAEYGIQPPVVGLHVFGDGPFGVRFFSSDNHHPPDGRALFKGPPVELAVMLGLELIQKRFRLVGVYQDKRLSGLEGIEGFKYLRGPFLRRHIPYVKSLSHGLLLYANCTFHRLPPYLNGCGFFYPLPLCSDFIWLGMTKVYYFSACLIF